MNILSIDIGGTYSRGAVFGGDSIENLHMLSAEPIKVSTSAFDSFNDLMNYFVQQLPQTSLNYSTFVLGVPGPVENNHYALLANVTWQAADVRHLQNLQGEIFLINDFVAQAFACLSPQMQVKDIKTGTRPATHNMCVVGAGTGLGHAALEYFDKKYHVLPSEAGHNAFAFDVTEQDYQRFVNSKKQLQGDYAINDQIVSGSGLLLLHEYLSGVAIKAEQIAQQIQADSPTAHYFARLYARSCRHYVLSLLDTCSVLYITGGVALNSPFLVDNDSFRQEFVNSAAKGSILQTLSIRLNQSDFMGLWGAAVYGILRQNRQLHGI